MESKIRIERTVDDLNIAYKLHHNKYNSRNKYVSWMFVIAGIAIALSPADGHAPSDKFLIAAIFLFIGGLSIRSRYNPGPRMAVQCPNALSEELSTLKEEEVISETSGSTLTVKWDAFADATVSEDMVLFYLNRIVFLFYPRRFFSDEEFAFLKAKGALCAARSQLHNTPAHRL